MLPWVGEEERMNNNNNFTSLGVIAIVAALALLGVVVVVTVAVTIPLQQAEARGCPLGTPAVNASQGRCFGH
jgi:hypothetical protein